MLTSYNTVCQQAVKPQLIHKSRKNHAFECLFNQMRCYKNVANDANATPNQ